MHLVTPKKGVKVAGSNSKPMKNIIKRFRSYWIQDVSFITLLLMMSFTIFILPVLIDMQLASMHLLNVMLLSIFFVGIWSAHSSRLIYISTIFFVLSLLLKLIRFSVLPLEFVFLERIVASINVLIFITINFNLLFRDNQFNFERILGAINVYLLFALLGAFLFEIISLTIGNSITGSIVLTGADEDFEHYIYFSLVSLTTVGFGDVIPANQASRMLSVALSALGILYPAVVIARLVSVGSAVRPKK
jgi:hypothetical protein